MHSINEKKSDLLKKYAFWGKKIDFQKFSNFSESVGRILSTPLAFWKLLIWTSCLSCLEYFQMALELKKIISILKINFSVLNKGKKYVLVLRFFLRSIHLE